MWRSIAAESAGAISGRDRALRLVWVAALGVALAACGGGSNDSSSSSTSGGSSSGSATSGVTTLELSSTTVSVQANVTDYSASQLINLTIANAQPGELIYGEGRYSTNGIAAAQFALFTTGETVSITFKAPDTVKPGTYTDEVIVEACTDSACAHQIAGSPKTISVTYTVAAVTGASAPTVALSLPSVSVQAFILDSAPPPNSTVNATFSNLSSTATQFTPYFNVSSTNNAVSAVSSDLFSDSAGQPYRQITISYKSPGQLGVGVYNDTVTVTACLDSGCVNPISNSPLTIPVQYSVSNTVSGTSGYTVNVVPIATNDIVWDPVHSLFYVSIPGSAATNANTIMTLDPTTGTLGSPVQVGSNPGAMDVSADGQYLYVALEGASAIQRLVLPGLTPDITIPLGNSAVSNSPQYAFELHVAPNAPHTVAVARSTTPVSYGNETGLAVFDDTSQRTDTVGANGTPTVTTFQWSADATQIFAANGSSTSADAEIIAVNSSGATLQSDDPGVFEFPGHIHLIGTSIYTDTGIVVSEPAFTQVGAFALACDPLCGVESMTPDAASNRAFFLDQGEIQSFNLTTFAPVATISLPGLLNAGSPKIIRWGTNGLAIHLGSASQDQTLLITGPFISQ